MTDKCAHQACHCPARMDNEYCSDHCAGLEHENEIHCHCGHPECQTMKEEE